MLHNKHSVNVLGFDAFCDVNPYHTDIHLIKHPSTIPSSRDLMIKDLIISNVTMKIRVGESRWRETQLPAAAPSLDG